MSDPHFDKVVALLPLFGGNNGTSFVDYSPIAAAVSTFGNAKTLTDQSRFYGSSGYFDGSGDYLRLPYHSSYSLDTDGTIEFWFRPPSLGAIRSLASFRPGSSASSNREWSLIQYYSSGSNVLVFAMYSPTGAQIVNVNASMDFTPLGEWSHIAVSRSGDAVTLFINGVARASGEVSGAYGYSTSSNTLRIGGLDYGGRYFLGHLQDFRLTRGVARYTQDFSPPGQLYIPVGRAAAPPLLAAPAACAARVALVQGGALSPLGVPSAVASLEAVVSALVSVPMVFGSPSAQGRAVAMALSKAGSPLALPEAAARVVPVARAAAESMLRSPLISGTVVRFELRGEVRDQGVLVDRRVRAYHRMSGELVGEVDTTAGRFAIPAGFAASEHYVLPIDLADIAADFAPPCANRVLSVLAMDDVA